MTITDAQKAEFQELTKPLIQWLNENCHPHVSVIVDQTSAELSEGICAVTTHEYLKD